jgi:hypothetical protein
MDTLNLSSLKQSIQYFFHVLQTLTGIISIAFHTDDLTIEAVMSHKTVVQNKQTLILGRLSFRPVLQNVVKLAFTVRQLIRHR